ncbi:HEPN domain-containing protein [Sphingobium chlorophenolicum]|uniref:Putative nucleotidyltransferase n=1 Tax=Sphingobium chlorophenolicum TaxID=46429 RepID=A0A081RCD5_SPHCR|nr:HEPN domain-containing protein [Sphingobium chlorophenolicum]KEQ52858.1 putative nucleotidyltransferase [Sphingobium chlorophenolicum]
MKMDLDHLPDVQRTELDRVQKILQAEFAEATSRASQSWKRNGKILKIILFGSYSRSDWVDEPENGYQSDFDLLIIVSHADLTDVADYWYVAEDKILRDEEVRRPVNIIVHTLDEVNQGLRKGEYFWVDIARDGIVLYDLPGNALSLPQPLTPIDAWEMASSYFTDWIRKTDSALKIAAFAVEENEYKDAAFLYHQAAERAYISLLLTRTLYFPRSHNIKFLRSLTEGIEPRLIPAWPRATRAERRHFELLKRAYVEARYSTQYDITVEDLETIAASVRALRDAVDLSARERIEQLRIDAGA